MHSLKLNPDLDERWAHLTASMVNTVLAAVAPGAALKRNFDPDRFTRPTHILAFGKASIPMTNAAIECLGDKFARATVISVAELCLKSEFKSKFVELLAADHPLPTQRNINATNRLVEHAKSIPEDHQALVLISGGGSALLCSPRDNFTLEDIVRTTTTMLKLGAPIELINATRSKLETLKAGGLAKLLKHTAQTDALVLSDVIGNDLLSIASGPVIDPSIQHTIIASNFDALDALCAWAAHQKINLVDVNHDAIGLAADQGNRLARTLIESTGPAPLAVCLGGEPTVDALNTSGTGGPMLELALASANELAQAADFPWTVITLATDGIDGPTDAAGAIITSDMIKPAFIKPIQCALNQHNALPMCDEIGATIRTGATGTNVNDIALAIRWADG